jgi:hypothetical protein
MGILEL